jgi:hypothetical protein
MWTSRGLSFIRVTGSPCRSLVLPQVTHPLSAASPLTSSDSISSTWFLGFLAAVPLPGSGVGAEWGAEALVTLVQRSSQTGVCL